MLIKAVLFDFDGTLTEPGSLDLEAVREVIRCPAGQAILEFIESLPSNEAREKALNILSRHEMEAARRARPNAGAEELVRYLISRNLKIGILSRNSRTAIQGALQNFVLIHESDFEVILSRDDPLMPKPSPDAIMATAKHWGLPADQVLVVGDIIFDIEAGRKAGARTVFLRNGGPAPLLDPPPDYIIGCLTELKPIVELFSPLASGKLPNDFLMQFLGELEPHDDSLLIAPGVGEDVAAVRLEGEEILVLKSDPVTLASDAIGYYAVVVNVNDVAASGATPRWLLTSLLLPPETSAAQVREIISQLYRVGREFGLTLCGGHTEITDAVTRPVVVGQVAGTVSKKNLIDKKRMSEGDHILLTKGIAVEGTCILCREFPARLEELGIPAEEIRRCHQFLTSPGISVLKEARIAAQSGAVTAMHDITEGGLATALEELSSAGKHRIRVYLNGIPILEETRRICRLLDIHPLGLIGSGSLLIACRPDASDSLTQSLREAGIDTACIGEVQEAGVGIAAFESEGGEAAPWPHFNVDEITRAFRVLARDPRHPRNKR